MLTTKLVGFFVFALHVENIDWEPAMLEVRVSNCIDDFLEMAVIVIEDEAWKRLRCGEERPKEYLQDTIRLSHSCVTQA